MPTGLVLLVVVGLVGVAVVLAFWNSADFTIHVDGGRARIKGRMARARKGEIADFFEQEFSAGERVTIRGWRRGRDRLRLRFSGNVPPGDQQRIRNFLVLLLCR